MNTGYIYILENKIFKDNLLKIGKTRKTPAERIKGLSSKTNMPSEFKLNYSRLFFDVDSAETSIFERLSNFRYNLKREFFTCSPEYAKIIINEVAIIDLEKEINRIQKMPKFIKEEPAFDKSYYAKIKRNWADFFSNVKWEFTSEFDENENNPDFILKIRDYQDDPFTEANDESFKEKNALIYIRPDIRTESEELKIYKNAELEKIVDVYRQSEGEKYLIILGKSPASNLTGCFFGWKLIGESFHQIRFVEHMDNNCPPLGLLDDDMSWSCMITGGLLEKENLYPEKEVVMSYWNKNKNAVPNNG